MTRHRRLRMLGFALAATVAWAIAPGAATADDHRRQRGDRYEHRDHGEHDRYRPSSHRFDRKHHAHGHDGRYGHRGPRHGFVRYGSHRWVPPRYTGPRAHRFHRHARSAGSWPYYCRDHRHGFRHRSHFDDHLVRFHHLPHGQLPRLVAQIGFGWTFGY